MALSHDLERIAAEAAAYAASGERVAGILAAEPLEIGRIYLCAYESGADHAWLAFDDEGAPVADRYRVRAAASLAGLCEVAEESAGGGDVPQLVARLGAASRRLEQALGDGAGSPFSAAMQLALPIVEELTAEIERTYKGPLA